LINFLLIEYLVALILLAIGVNCDHENDALL